MVQSIFVLDGSGNIPVRETTRAWLSNQVVHRNQLNVGGFAFNRFISPVIVVVFHILSSIIALIIRDSIAF